MTGRPHQDRYRTLRLMGALASISVVLGACNYPTGEVVTGTIPGDYRARHPIAVTEADRSVVIFVGHARGSLTTPQRADVLGLARISSQEGTGAMIVDVPVDTVNSRAAAALFQEIRGLLASSGVPSHAITLRRYHPD